MKCSSVGKKAEANTQRAHFSEGSKSVWRGWPSRFAVILTAFVSFGCITLRQPGSSRDHISVEQSSVLLPYSIDDSVRAFSDAFLKRGYQIVDRQTTSPSHVLVKFRGGHLPIASVNAHGIAGETNVIGSVFVAELTSVDSATTMAYLFGKPTQNGLEPCTSFDHAG